MRRHLTFANVCSALALFVAVSTGGAYAASKLITGKQIKDRTITARDVKPRSLTARLFKVGQLPAGARGPAGADGAAGAPGAQGAAGAEGARGPTGPAGASLFTDPLPPGTVVTGIGTIQVYGAQAGGLVGGAASFPVPIPADTEVRAKPSSIVQDNQEHAGCTGTYSVPTAPAGMICVYDDIDIGIAQNTLRFGLVARSGFKVFANEKTPVASNGELYLEFSWAYTAP